MDSEEGPSMSKRRRKAVDYYIDNLKKEILCEDSESEQKFCIYPDHEELSNEEVENKDMLLRPLVPVCNISLSPDGKQAQEVEIPLNQPSYSGGPSMWTTTGELLDLKFRHVNAFYGHLSGNDPIDFFNFFFDESLLSMICIETNNQANRLLVSEKNKESSRIKNWKELKVEELKVFLGLLFHMGTISLTRIQDYWKKDRLFSIPIFGEQMGRNRFLLITRCLHFTSELESADYLYEIRKVIDYFNDKMKSCYDPAKELCIDESMIFCRKYIKDMRRKNGTKLYMLADSNDLVLKIMVYAGIKDMDVAGKDHAEKVVMELLGEKLNNGHAVYMDSYYNSFDLAKKLISQKTYSTGTLRKDLTENPKDVIDARLKKGENVSRFREGVHIGKWKDKRDIVYISTQYEEKMVPVTSRRGQGREIPEAIARYNDFMSGILQQDHLAFYPCERITLRWYLKVAIHTFQLLFINSYKFYNKYSGKPMMRLYDYRLSVVNSLLLDKATPGPRQSRPPRTEQRHKLNRITEKAANGRVKRKHCRQCYKAKQKRKDSYYHCLSCSGHPGLCVECFDDYHKQQ